MISRILIIRDFNYMKHIKTFSDKVDYDLLRVIDEGGMATVYEARQKGPDKFEKTVAIKFILEEYSAIKEFRANFIGEAQLVADLVHSNIVQIYHLGQKDLQYYIVMEYVDGINLEDFLIRHLETKEEIPVSLAVFLISRVCAGLSYAHQKRNKKGIPLSIVHRDVNPRNILLAYEGGIKLTDFGIAKAQDLMYNKEGERIAGKDEYLSPEQALKQVTDARADIFSCGIILAELLLGYNIFEGDTGEIARQNIIQCKVPDFTQLSKRIDPKLNKILHKALNGSLNHRYQTAREFLIDLETYLYGDDYGPTHEKLAQYLLDLFNTKDPDAIHHWKKNIKTSVRDKKTSNN